jgi:DNA repair protein RadC
LDFAAAPTESSDPMTIRDWPSEERPREKLLARGPGALSDAELLAVFLGSGGAARARSTSAATCSRAPAASRRCSTPRTASPASARSRGAGCARASNSASATSTLNCAAATA